MGKLAGNARLAPGLEALVTLLTQGKGLAGLDKTRPWGAVVPVSVPGQDLRSAWQCGLLLRAGDRSEATGRAGARSEDRQAAGPRRRRRLGYQVGAGQPLFRRAEGGLGLLHREPRRAEERPRRSRRAAGRPAHALHAGLPGVDAGPLAPVAQLDAQPNADVLADVPAREFRLRRQRRRRPRRRRFGCCCSSSWCRGGRC